MPTPLRLSIALASTIFLAAVAGVAAQQHPPAAPTAAKATITTVATVREIMEGIVIPSSNAVFEAAGEPPNADDPRWKALRSHAVLLAEAGNLLLVPGRAKPNADWSEFAVALRDNATAVMNAAAAKNAEAFSAASDAMYESCANCHEKYLTQR